MSLLVHRVLSVFADANYAIDCARGAAETERTLDAAVDFNAVLRSDSPANVVLRELIDVEGDDIDLWLKQPFICWEPYRAVRTSSNAFLHASTRST